MTVKALYPVWKTWWAKWNDAQRNAFNTLRAEGLSLNEAALRANQTVTALADPAPQEDVEPPLTPVPAAPRAGKTYKTYKPRAKKA
jgi:hypothetical protein